MEILLNSIGFVRSPRQAAEDDNWGGIVSAIELDPERFTHESLAGLADFSHADIVFFFDRISPDKIETGARHPRNRTDLPKVGIFAQRGRNRPNRIGVSTCRILGVEGMTVTVEGLDAIDGTPVVDIKPHVKEFDPRGEVRQPAWSHELMKSYY
jgi:tRNA (adenine37-N6)-methyltransferase